MTPCALAFFFVLLLGPLATASEVPTASQAENPECDIYLLIGQSNMAGRGGLDEAHTPIHPREKMFTEWNQWAPAVEPLHSDRKGAGAGLGASFARAMAELRPEVAIGLVPCAVGGTPLFRWQKGGDL